MEENGPGRCEGGVRGHKRALSCKNWYSISRTASDSVAHRGNTDDRSVRAFTIKPRAFGAPLGGVRA
jgi:hypothetical protein